ncbi:MAG TPA: competence/damage-inducible protein A [Polyangiales bacterium]|nr:competence/damage-inducible protein A [Polyangiales bacterium]
MARTAAALIIGNEILTGKVSEANVFVMAKELFALGVELRRIVVCPDEIPVIARDLRELSSTHDIVITSGGIGPTHDDVTIKAVAAAFGGKVVRSAEYEQLLQTHYGDRLTATHLRMADVPEGSRLISTVHTSWPTVVMKNVYVFPGVPQIFSFKFPVMREELKDTSRFYSHAVFVALDEPALAPLLDELAAVHTGVNIGSYLYWGDDADYRTKLTIDGRDQPLVEACYEAMLAGIPRDKIVRTE